MKRYIHLLLIVLIAAQLFAQGTRVVGIPPEAFDKMDQIRANGYQPVYVVKDDIVYNNIPQNLTNANGVKIDTEKLPTNTVDGKSISYQEFDIYPPKYKKDKDGNNFGKPDRGVERIIIGFVDGKEHSVYYTPDHYGNFARIDGDNPPRIMQYTPIYKSDLNRKFDPANDRNDPPGAPEGSDGRLRKFGPRIYHDRNTPGHSNDNNPPGRPGPGGGTPPPPPPTLRTKSGSDEKEIRRVTDQYKTFPGGWIIQAAPVMDFSMKKVVYDAEQQAFVVNGNYTFYPDLNEEELGALYQTACLNQDTRIGAVNFNEMVGIPEDCAVAYTLGMADQALGQIAYGYSSADGNRLPDFQTVAGYINPLDADVEDFRARKKSRILNHCYVLRNNLQPRLFVQHRSVAFALDKQKKLVYPTEEDIAVQYQVFGTTHNTRFAYAAQTPETYFPHFVAAVKHLEKNYSAYENVQPHWQTARKYAEAFAFFSATRQQNIPVENAGILLTAYQKRQPITLIYNDYNYIDSTSDLFKYNRQSLEAWNKVSLEGWSDADKYGYYSAMLDFALQTLNTEQIIRYKKYCKSIAYQLYNAGFFTLAAYQGNLAYFDSRLPGVVNSQINFAFKYKVSDYNVSWTNGKKALRFLVDLWGKDTTNFWYLQSMIGLVDLYNFKELHEFQQVYLTVLQQSAETNDPSAQYKLGMLLYEGKAPASLDKNKGAEWLIRSAKNGYPDAQNAVGGIYLEMGKNDPEKRKNAVELIEKIAVRDNDGAGGLFPDAEYNMARVYELGWKDGRPDMTKAREWYSKAAADGHAKAKTRLLELDLNPVKQ